jgi:hypothetical protein
LICNPLAEKSLEKRVHCLQKLLLKLMGQKIWSPFLCVCFLVSVIELAKTKSASVFAPLWWSVLCTKKLLTILEENDATTADMRRYRAKMQTT